MRFAIDREQRGDDTGRRTAPGEVSPSLDARSGTKNDSRFSEKPDEAIPFGDITGEWELLYSIQGKCLIRRRSQTDETSGVL